MEVITRRLNRLAAACVVLVLISGCAKNATRNDALYSGTGSAMTFADGKKGQPAALGAVPQPEKVTATDRLMAPFRAVTGGLEKKTVDPISEPDPISLGKGPKEASPEVFLSAARLMSGAGNTENAKSIYQTGLVAFPDNRDAMLELARIHVQLREFQQATDLYLDAVEKHPDDPIVFNDVALFHMQQRNHELGIKSFHRAIELDGTRKLYRNNLANAYVELGREDLALEQLLAVERRPVAHYNLGYLLYSHQKLDAALAQFDRAYQADHSFQNAYLMFGRVQEEIKRRQMARANNPIQRVSFEKEADPNQSTLKASSIPQHTRTENAQPTSSQSMSSSPASMSPMSSKPTVTRQPIADEASSSNEVIITPAAEATSLEEARARGQQLMSSPSVTGAPRVIVLDADSGESMEQLQPVLQNNSSMQPAVHHELHDGSNDANGTLRVHTNSLPVAPAAPVRIDAEPLPAEASSELAPPPGSFPQVEAEPLEVEAPTTPLYPSTDAPDIEVSSNDVNNIGGLPYRYPVRQASATMEFGVPGWNGMPSRTGARLADPSGYLLDLRN